MAVERVSPYFSASHNSKVLMAVERVSPYFSASYAPKGAYGG